MREYLEIVKITFKLQIAYRFDVITGVLFSFARILLAFILWSVMFRGKDTIAGFSFAAMMTYYIIMSFFRRLDLTDGIVWQLSAEIREGQFSKYLVRPVRPLGYFVASALSKTAFVFGINLLATIGYGFIFHHYFLIRVSPVICLSAVLIWLLGLNFMILLSYFIAVLSFKFIDVGALNMIKGTILEFLTGALIPLAILPVWLQEGMRLFPFYYVYYYPTMLFLNDQTGQIPAAILIMIMWNGLMLAVISVGYGMLRRRYEGVGA